MYRDVLFAFVSVHHVYAWCLWTSEEGARFHRTEVTGCNPPCGSWKLNPGPLEEPPGLLTTEPLSIASLFFYYL